MKKRISITVDPGTDKLLEKLIEKRRYRSKSHAIEEIIILYSKEVKNEK